MRPGTLLSSTESSPVRAPRVGEVFAAARRLALAASALAVIAAVALPATARATAQPAAALVPGMPVSLAAAVFLGGVGLGLALARPPRAVAAGSGAGAVEPLDLLDRVPVAVAVVDRDLVVRHANPALRRLGADGRRPRPAGRRLGELLPVAGIEPLVEEAFLRARPVAGLRLPMEEAAGGHGVRVSVQLSADGRSAVVTAEDLRHTEHLLERLDRLARAIGASGLREGGPCACS